jgi:hypothetical protein
MKRGGGSAAKMMRGGEDLLDSRFGFGRMRGVGVFGICGMRWEMTNPSRICRVILVRGLDLLVI